MPAFDRSAFGPAFSALLREPRLPELGPGLPNQALRTALSALTPENSFTSLSDRTMALGCISGFWLLHDFLDESHAISLDLDTPTGSYWHGIMHRREPDYDNARYWFRRVGDHPIFPEIGREIGELLGEKQFAARLRFPRVLDRRSHWDAMAFIDLCEWCGTAWDDRAQAAARLQEVEMRLLLEYTCRAAQGAN